MNHITGIITTLNEEHNIEACIKSLQLICDEIIVVDSLSTDKTLELAKTCGAKVYIQIYLGDGVQKNVGLTHAANTWIFSLDADERISPELANEINAIDIENTPYDAFAVKRKNFIGSRWVKSAIGIPII
jgi:glycosyltransferase involved in cell wall biosynthesis